MKINSNEVHVWIIDLLISFEEEAIQLGNLSMEEQNKVQQIRFPLPKKRYIAAHFALRKIISHYLGTPMQTIAFHMNQQKKPFLATPNPLDLQFNMSHSHNIALVALTGEHAIGIDIEKIRDTYNPGIVKRYFHPKEITAFNQLSEQEKTDSFYQIWSRKEALIKADGKGLSIPLSSFAVSTSDEIESIVFDNKTWTILPLAIDKHYKAALASNQSIKTIEFWHFSQIG